MVNILHALRTAGHILMAGKYATDAVEQLTPPTLVGHAPAQRRPSHLLVKAAPLLTIVTENVSKLS